jgi:tripartite-type tricarboxylate transporter receptor subunit TctC
MPDRREGRPPIPSAAEGIEPYRRQLHRGGKGKDGHTGNINDFPRRRFLHLVAAGALPSLVRVARAEIYPARPVRLLVGFEPGGPTDVVARLVGQWLSERFGQPFIVENRSGAATNIATETVVRAPPDGYTLLLANAANAINATLYDNLKFNFIRDIVPVAAISLSPLVVEVNPSVPAGTVPEFVAYARANPGKINFASGGIGAPNHMAGELFKAMTGLDMIHVPYRGEAPALTDLIAGRVQVMFGVIVASIEHIRVGRLRALAVTSSKRLPAMPNLPTVSDFVPGYEASQWYGIGAPRNTPADIIDNLNNQINAALGDEKIRARLNELGSVPTPMTSAEFGRYIVEETAKWGRVAKLSSVKPD